MRLFLGAAGMLSLGLWAGLGAASPIKGTYSFKEKLSGQSVSPEGKKTPGQFEIKETFRGGRRACVIVQGDHDPVVDLGVYVYDSNQQLVAKDDGRGDIVAAIWYPPRDGSYKIVVHNSGEQWNRCYIVVK